MGIICPSYDKARQKLGDVLPLSTPFTVILDASEICNFKCSYCFRGDGNADAAGYTRSAGLMSWDTFLCAADQALSFDEPVRHISLSHQGEPLCNRRIPDMVRYIKGKGFTGKISIHTNASLLDEEYVCDLADSGIDKIVVSLQGLNDEAYLQTCDTRVDVQRLRENLAQFYRLKKNTQVNIKIPNVALRHGEEDTFYEWALPICDRAFIETVVPIWKNTSYGKNNAETCLQNKYGEIFPRQDCCPVSFHTLCVITNGDVYPCTQILYPSPIGNIQSSTLKELWNSSERSKLLLQQLEGRCPAICENCYIKINSVWTDADLIDPYREEIYDRLIKGRNLN